MQFQSTAIKILEVKFFYKSDKSTVSVLSSEPIYRSKTIVTVSNNSYASPKNRPKFLNTQDGIILAIYFIQSLRLFVGFSPILLRRIENRSLFQICGPLQIRYHPCYVHQVGLISFAKFLKVGEKPRFVLDFSKNWI